MTAKYTNLAYNDSQVYNLQRYLVDEVSDIQDLPTNCGPGSKAIVAANGDSYLLNNKHEWKKQLVSTGGNNNAASEISIVQTIDNSSVQDKVPSAKAVYDFVTANILFIEARENNGQVTLNKTFDEIANVFFHGGSCKIVNNVNGTIAILSVSDIIVRDNIYFVGGVSAMSSDPLVFGTNSTDGYPILNYKPEEESSEPHFQLTYDQTINMWRWITDDPNFNIVDFISANSGDNNIEVYAKINNNSEILMTILWTDDSADSDVLVITGNDSNATYKFALYTDNTANLLETRLIPQPK